MIKIEDLKEIKDVKEINGLELYDYIPMEYKMGMIDGIVKTIVKKDEKGMYNYNSLTLEIYEKVSMISLYTNIEVDQDDVENYDILMKNGLLNKIEDEMYQNRERYEIPDYQLYYDLLEERIKDKMRENSFEYIVAERTKELTDSIDVTMEHLNKMIDKGDPNKIAKYFSKFMEQLTKKLPDMSQLNFDKLKNKGK